MNDMIGNEIQVGSVIVYPGRRGSSLWMNVGFVLEIGEKTLKVDVPTEKTHWYKDGFTDKGWSTKKLTRKVTLHNVDLVTVIDRDVMWFLTQYKIGTVVYHRCLEGYKSELVETEAEILRP